MHDGRAQRAFGGGDERIARELHDVTLQDLAVLRLRLTRLGLATAGTPLHDDVATALETVRDTIVNLRGLLADARPPALERIGLTAALGVLAESWRRDAEVLVIVELDISEPVSRLGDRIGSDVEVTAFRCVQEVGRNSIRHARPHRIDVELHETPLGVVLDLRDDGCGFDPGAPTAGHGLGMMRERVSAVGGRLVVVSRIGGGTAIRVRIPARTGVRTGRFTRRSGTAGRDGPGLSAKA